MRNVERIEGRNEEEDTEAAPPPAVDAAVAVDSMKLAVAEGGEVDGGRHSAEAAVGKIRR